MKKLLIIISLLIFIGGVCLIVFGSIKISKDEKYNVKRTYDITEEVTNINIDVDTSDLEIIYFENGDESERVETIETDKISYDAQVNEGTLYIKTIDERKFYDRFFSFVDLKMKIYLNKNTLGDVKIEIATGDILINKEFSVESLNIKGSTGDINLYMNKADDVDVRLSTGDIKIENSSLSSLKVDLSTGRTNLKNIIVTGDINLISTTGRKNLENVKCNKLEIDSSTGDLSMKKVECTGIMTIEQSTGDVDFDDIDAEKISIDLSSGKVIGYFYTDWTIYAKSSSGNVDVPHRSGKICEITTKSGKIIVQIK